MTRHAVWDRSTKETKTNVILCLDGGALKQVPTVTGERKNKHAFQASKAQYIDIDTGIGFLDHMIHQLAKHGGWSLYLRCEGDLHIDDHHTCEDAFITLGLAFKEALGEGTGLQRFGHAYAPLDEALSRAVVDLSNRPFAVIDLQTTREKIGALSMEMLPHALHSFAMNAGITLHITNLYGSNDHHKVESSFKALARALMHACGPLKGMEGEVMSSKGVLLESIPYVQDRNDERMVF